MLTLITGQPGNYKTCRTLEVIEKLRKESGREVYYWNIPDLKLPWKPLGNPATFGAEGVEPDASEVINWPSLPGGSIIVIDEAQKVFRLRPQGAAVPKHVSALETHRHRGFDLYLLTQNRMLIDSAVRALTGWHTHMLRRSGLKQANVYEWEECRDPTSDKDKKDARHSIYKPGPDVYGWYKSADMHTVRRNLPWKKIGVAVVALVVVLASASFTAHHVMTGAGVVEQIKPAEAEGVESDRKRGAPGRDPWAAEYRAPRVERFERTAPMYDHLQRVMSQPKLAGCMMLEFSGGELRCECSTDQGTLLDITTRECRRLIREGWFDETRVVESAKVENIRRLNARDGVGSSREGGPSSSGSSSASP